MLPDSLKKVIVKEINLLNTNDMEITIHRSHRHRRLLFIRPDLTPLILGLSVLLLSLAACKDADDNSPNLEECVPVDPTGNISQTTPSGPYTFRTSGGGTIVIDTKVSVSITHDEYPGFEIEMWGSADVNGVTKTSALHENLNGKHIKNRQGDRRTIIFPDGAKVTMVAADTDGPLRSISIYDGVES